MIEKKKSYKVLTKKYSEIYDKLGYKFNDTKLLQQALTHKSYSINFNYEYLEFIGDHILGMIISISLFKIYSHYNIGQLARHYNNCVSETCLIDIANKLELSKYVLLSKDLVKNRFDSIIADICEAIVGAIFLDSDYYTVEKFITEKWQEKLYATDFVNHDAKSELQELAQKFKLGIPKYQLLNTAGKAHNPNFIMKVVVEGLGYAEGSGSRKQIAERNAAKSLLQNFGQHLRLGIKSLPSNTKSEDQQE